MGHSLRIALGVAVCAHILTAQPQTTVPMKVTTVSTGNDVDDCAIWVHPLDPAKSLVIVNDKGPEVDPAGLYIYTLSGKLLQKTVVYQPQNPDIRYNVVFGTDTFDVVVCSDREAGNNAYNRIRIFRIDPSKAEASSGFLTEITSPVGIPTGQNQAYGHSLYLRPSDGALFSIVSSYGKDDFTQIRLENDGAGKVKGTIVRTWGGSDIKGDLCEGICCDDELGYVYICDENTQVLKYYADPDKKINTLVGVFAQNDGIKSDREGINIYRCTDSAGYILVSSQGNDQIKVYDRVTNAFLGTVIPEGMKDCDGLDVTAVPLGPQFPHGMAAFHLGSTAGAQFGFYDWSDIATGLQLATPCDAIRPTNSASVATVPSARPQFVCKTPVVYWSQNAIMVSNIPDVSNDIMIELFDIKGNKIGSFTRGSYRNGCAVIPVQKSTLSFGTYTVRCKVGNASFITSQLTLLR